MKAGKIYYFSKDSLKFVEARWARTKLVAAVAVATLVAGYGIVEINQMAGDVLGLHMGRVGYLTAENDMLKGQLRMLSGRLSSLEQRLTTLNDQGNEFRLLVDLPKIDEDTRKAGIGGTEDNLDFGFSSNVNDLLGSLHHSMDRAERELQLQYRSYQEVDATYEKNKVRFAHLPAIKPMVGYYDVHSFGMRMHPVLHIRKMHEGLDIANDVGTPVYAAADGVIEFAGRTGGGYGIMVEINHGYGYTTAYAHLSKVLVREGQKVKRGDLIAKSGRTGLVSGPHLHYEVRYKGVRQNPIDYFFDDISVQDYRRQLAALD